MGYRWMRLVFDSSIESLIFLVDFCSAVKRIAARFYDRVQKYTGLGGLGIAAGGDNLHLRQGGEIVIPLGVVIALSRVDSLDQSGGLPGNSVGGEDEAGNHTASQIGCSRRHHAWRNGNHLLHGARRGDLIGYGSRVCAGGDRGGSGVQDRALGGYRDRLALRAHSHLNIDFG
jgi:hypothetical protein